MISFNTKETVKEKANTFSLTTIKQCSSRQASVTLDLKREWKYGAGEGLLIGRGAGTFPIKFLHLEITESSAAGHSQQPTSAANTWCILQLIMTLLNYFTYCKIVL